MWQYCDFMQPTSKMYNLFKNKHDYTFLFKKKNKAYLSYGLLKYVIKFLIL